MERKSQDISEIQQSLEKIVLTENSLFNMVRSVVETYPNESMGFSWGYPNENSLILTNSFPVQTAKRTPSNVCYGNKSVAKRLRDLDFSISSKGDLGFLFVGGYHSHPGPSKIYGSLSNGDLDFIEGEIGYYGLDFWIENLLIINKVNQGNKKNLDYSFKKMGRDISTIFRISPRIAYSIKIKSFLVNAEGKSKKLDTIF